MKREERPLIKIENDLYNILLDLTCGILLIISTTKVLTNWIKLPLIIPSHFNFAGEVNGFGNKNFILILPSVMIFLFITFTILEKFPNRFNYPIKINYANAEIQYKLAVKLLKITKVEVLIIFTYLSNAIINSAIERRLTLNKMFLPIILISIFLTMAVYIYKAIKNK